MKSLKQLEMEYYIRTKSLSYWASVVKPSCENCWKDYECELLQELEKIDKELVELEQEWDSWKTLKYVKTHMYDFTKCAYSYKMVEDKKRDCREEKQVIAKKLFKEKARTEDKITSCLNKRTFLAIKFYHNNFLNQDCWNIAHCMYCRHYSRIYGACPILCFYPKTSRRICEHYDGMGWSELRKVVEGKKPRGNIKRRWSK